MNRALSILSCSAVIAASAAMAPAQQSITNGIVTFQYFDSDPQFGFVPDSIRGPASSVVSFVATDAWVLTVWDPVNTSRIALPPSQCVLPTPTVTQFADRFVATWSGVTSPSRAPGLSFDLTVRGSAPANSLDVEFDIDVTVSSAPTAPAYAIYALEYLRLEVMPIDQASTPDTLAWSYSDGWLLDDAARNARIVAPPPSDYDGNAFYPYPGPQSMQWGFLFDSSSERGLYYANKDPNGYHKGMQFARRPNAALSSDVVLVSTRHFPVDNLNAQQYRPNYPMVISAFDDGWFAAAKHYREWAVANLSAVANGPIETNPELSSRVRDADFFGWWTPEACPGPSAARKYESFANLQPLMADFQAALALPTDTPSICYHWDFNAFEARLGEWFPASPDFVNAVSATNQPVGSYFQANDIEVSVPGAGLLLSNAVLVDELGALIIADPESTQQKQFANCGDPTPTISVQDAALNPHAPLTQAYVQWYASALVQDLGVGGLYLDAFTQQNSRTSYATNHGHIPGGGTWWADGLSFVVQAARAHVGTVQDPDFFVVSEGPQETTMDALDGTIWKSVVLDDPSEGRRLAPLFRTVFHEYHRSLDFDATVLPSTHPAYGDAGVWMRARQRLAAGLFLGSMPIVGGVLPAATTDTLANLRANSAPMDLKIEMMARVAEVIVDPVVRSHILFGERMRDFIDTGTGTWTAPNTPEDYRPYGLVQPYVYGVAYRNSANNSSGILFVNWTDGGDAPAVAGGAQTVSISVDAEDVGLVPGTYTQTVRSTGTTPVVTPGFVWSNPLSLSFTVPERGAVFVSWQ